jgi:hypothetical protein
MVVGYTAGLIRDVGRILQEILGMWSGYTAGFTRVTSRIL